MKRVAIQGIKGSYHHQVANEYFKDKLEIIEFLSFDEVANSIFEEDELTKQNKQSHLDKDSKQERK